jgi:hypothetical protein
MSWASTRLQREIRLNLYSETDLSISPGCSWVEEMPVSVLLLYSTSS